MSDDIKNGKATNAELSNLKDSVKGYIDSNTNTSKLQMIHLQSLEQSLEQIFSMISNVMEKSFQTLGTITGNMR